MSTATVDIYDAPQADLGMEVPDVQSGIFGHKGRLSVLGYMARSAILLLCMAALGLGAYFAVGGESIDGMSAASGVVVAIAVVLMIPIMWVGFVMMIKRLHDINMSGWWTLATMIPIVGMIFTLFIALKPGNQEGNRFGKAVHAQGWEKPVGILGIVLTIAMVAASVGTDVMAILG